MLPNEHESTLIAPGQKQRGSAAKLKLDWKRALHAGRLPFRRLQSRPERELIERLAQARFGPRPVFDRAESPAGSRITTSRFAPAGNRILSGSARNCRSSESTAATRWSVTRPPASAAWRRRSFITSEVCSSPGSSRAERSTRSRLREPAMLPRLAALLGHLHEGWDLVTGEVLYFCAFQTVRTYAQTAARLKAVASARHRSNSRRYHRAIAADRPVSARALP